MSDIANDNYLTNIKHILNTEVMQFTRGKTEKTMEYIQECVLSYLSNDSNDEYTIPIIITNKSLAETDQWRFRLKNKFNGRDNINVKVVSCKAEADYNDVDRLCVDLLGCQRVDIPNIIVMCCHSKRVSDCIKILQQFSVSRRFVEPIKFSFIFDEADKNINLICRFLKKVNREKYKNQSNESLITDIQYMTATPLEDFWKKLSKHGIHELLNMDHYLEQPEHTFDELRERYKWLQDHNKIFYESDSNPVGYVKEIISDGLISSQERNIVFVPGENRVKTHKAIREIFLGMNYTVLEHNTNKRFFDPNGVVIPLEVFKEEHNIEGELRDVLRKWNELYPTRSLAITGYFTIERGITFNTDGFNFTHMIISKYHMNKMNSLLQLCGRGHGHTDYVDTMNVILPEEVWLMVKELVENLLELKRTNPEKYNSSDFSQKDSTIPVKLDLIDEEFKTEIFAMIPEGGFRGRSAQQQKDALSSKLEEGVTAGKIRMEDNNNVNKFRFSERSLKGCKAYRGGTDVTVRRFENFNKNFTTRTPSAQSGDCDEYAIDFAINDYHIGSFTNPNNIAWITYRK